MMVPVHLEAIEALRSLFSPLSSRSLKETNKQSEHWASAGDECDDDCKNNDEGNDDDGDGAYGWTSWTCSSLLAIFSIRPL